MPSGLRIEHRACIAQGKCNQGGCIPVISSHFPCVLSAPASAFKGGQFSTRLGKPHGKSNGHSVVSSQLLQFHKSSTADLTSQLDVSRKPKKGKRRPAPYSHTSLDQTGQQISLHAQTTKKLRTCIISTHAKFQSLQDASLLTNLV